MEHQDLFKKHSDFIWDIANLLRGQIDVRDWQAPESRQSTQDKDVA